jgi:hypothetical protein
MIPQSASESVETVDGIVIDTSDMDHPAPVSVVSDQSTAVVRRERRSEVIRPLNADELVESFAQYQELLPKLLDDSDYQAAGKDKKTGKIRRFVKKSGWRKIATAFDLDVQIIRSTVERDDTGQPCRAEVWARAIAPSGRSMDGDGYCSVDEERFTYANGKQKLENDLRATATTRAMNRAISGLVGMGEVSAEEMSGGGHTDAAPAIPAHAVEASQAAKEEATKALHAICYGNEQVAAECWQKITARLGGMPAAATYALSAAYRSMLAASPVPGGDGASGEAQAGDSPTAAPDAQEPLL